MKRILVTGGAGFIGSHFVDYLLDNHDDEVIVLDKLTYAADMGNIESRLAEIDFVHGDITCPDDLAGVFDRGIDWVVHFAAETHVDNSIEGPVAFAETNVIGTLRLLMSALECGVDRFLHISTDEVYGSRETGHFVETDAHLPSSPYAATKSGAEKLVWAYHVTYGLPVLMTRSSNNYGPRQHREKLIPKCVLNAIAGEPIPVYGTGRNMRDWLFVRDNCRAIDTVLRQGRLGQAYNIAAQCALPNLDLAHKVVSLTGASADLVRFVEDRKGHDMRYAVDTALIEQLGWRPTTDFEDGLRETVQMVQADFCRALVTGGTGYIGSILVDFLRRHHHVASVLPLGSRDLDVTDRSAVARCMAEETPCVVFHLAAKADTDWCEVHFEDARRVNVDGSVNVVEEGLARGARVVYFSSACLYPDNERAHAEDSPLAAFCRYTETKLLAEQALAPYADRILNIRMRQPFSNHRHSRNLLQKLASYTAFIDDANSMSHLESCLPVIYALSRSGGTGPYNLTNEGWTTPLRIARLICEYWRPELDPVEMSYDDLLGQVSAHRVNSLVDCSKLAAEGHRLGPVEDAVVDCLRSPCDLGEFDWSRTAV